jgi:hypothetical protein
MLLLHVKVTMPFNPSLRYKQIRIGDRDSSPSKSALQPSASTSSGLFRRIGYARKHQEKPPFRNYQIPERFFVISANGGEAQRECL